jgi:hypothetical protein
MRKDLIQLNTRINRNSFGDYGKNVLEKLSDEKKVKQKRKSEAFIEETITSLNNHYLRWCNELCLTHWVVKRHLPKFLPESYSTIIFQTIQTNKTKLMLNISHRTTTAILTFSILLALSERILQANRKWRKQQ